MRRLSYYSILAIAIFIGSLSCTSNGKTSKTLVDRLGSEEYNRLMTLSINDFDQSATGFRQYSGDYELVSLIIPEYLKVNNITPGQARNIHWHLGQVHAFNGNYEAAIAEMKQSYVDGSKSWECYVTGSIAFLEQDGDKLLEAIKTLSEQENQMNIEILNRFARNFNKSYSEAMSAE